MSDALGRCFKVPKQCSVQLPHTCASPYAIGGMYGNLYSHVTSIVLYRLILLLTSMYAQV